MTAILDLYMSVKRAEKGKIPMMDISNHQIIKRFEKVLNDLLQDRINKNKANNEIFIQARKEISQYGK